MVSTSRLRDWWGKMTYRQWLTEIVGDVRRLSRAAGLTIREGGEGLWAGARRKGLRRELHRPDALDRLPPWLLEILRDDRSEHAFTLFELVCAYRCPFKRPPMSEFGGYTGRDPWLWWTAMAAEGLFAFPSWVRFTDHLFTPMSLPSHPERDKHVDLGAQVWSKLLNISFIKARRKWYERREQVEWDSRGDFRQRFWQEEAPYQQLTGI